MLVLLLLLFCLCGPARGAWASDDRPLRASGAARRGKPGASGVKGSAGQQRGAQAGGASIRGSSSTAAPVRGIAQAAKRYSLPWQIGERPR